MAQPILSSVSTIMSGINLCSELIFIYTGILIWNHKFTLAQSCDNTLAASIETKPNQFHAVVVAGGAQTLEYPS